MSKPENCECGCFRPGKTYHTPWGPVILCDECREQMSKTAEEMDDAPDPCSECGGEVAEGVCTKCGWEVD